MNADSFIDTNILVYAVDTIDEEKHRKAQELISGLIGSGRAVISTQVLQEFYNVATRKLHIPKEKAFAIVNSLCAIRVADTTPQIVKDAICLNIEHQFSFWDSLIISAAISEACSVLYSEDLNDGQTINGVKIVNPFA